MTPFLIALYFLRGEMCFVFICLQSVPLKRAIILHLPFEMSDTLLLFLEYAF